MVSRAHCIDCGAPFARDVDETWKVRCIACYVRLKRARTTAADDCDEFVRNLRLLIQLCHPDKHGGSEAATRATRWLLSVRNRVAAPVE